jgi:hypothetical protein
MIWVIIAVLEQPCPDKNRLPPYPICTFDISLGVISDHIVPRYLYSLLLCPLLKQALRELESPSFGLPEHRIFQIFHTMNGLKDGFQAVDEDTLAVAWEMVLVCIYEVWV